MSGENKSAKEVTFALAIVKACVIPDRAQSSRIEAAIRLMFPGVSVILVAESDELTNHRRRQELSDFARGAACRVVSSSRISSN